MEVEKIAAYVACIGVIVLGTLFAGLLVYRAFIYPNVLKSYRWRKAEAKVIERRKFTAQSKPSVTSAPPPHYEGYEKVIEYTVKDETYTKTVDDSYEGSFDIYYDSKNPNKMMTGKEMRQNTSRERIGMYIALLIIPAVLIFCGIFFMNGI